MHNEHPTGLDDERILDRSASLLVTASVRLRWVLRRWWDSLAEH